MQNFQTLLAMADLSIFLWRITVECDRQTVSQLRRIGKEGAQCRLLCDFPVRIGSWIYFINLGIRLLMYS